MRFGLLSALAILLVVIIVGSSAIFTVSQTEQALVLRFGEPQDLVTEPGLHFKQPFVESVVYLDNRILDLEAPQQEVLASDNQRILVDAFVRYHIADPLKFYQTVGSISGANNQLASVLNSAIRRVLSEATLPEIVKDRRAELMVKIRDQVNKEAASFGAAINDVRIRRAAQTITAKADRDVVVLKAEAQREADQTRGEGDAARNRIFAEAFGKDPGFFAFYRSMQAYAAGLKPGDTRLVLSPTSEFFRFFANPNGTAEGQASTAPAVTAGTAAPAMP